MKNSNAAVISVQLDTTSIESSVSELSAVIENLEQIVANLAESVSNVFEGLLQGIDTIENIERIGTTVGNVANDMLKLKKKFNIFKSLVPGTVEAFESIKQIIPTVWNSITGSFNGKGTLISEKASSVLEPLIQVFSGVGNSIMNISKSIGTALSGMSLGSGAMIAAIIAAIIGLVVLIIQNWDTIKAAIGAAAEWINTNVIQPIIGFATELWSSITTIVGQIWNGIIAVFSGIGQWVYDNVILPVMNIFLPIVEFYMSLFGSIWQTISDVFYNIGVVASGCWDIIQAVWQIVADWFDTNVIQPVAVFFSTLWGNVTAFAATAWENIKTVLSTIGRWIDTNVIQPVAKFFTGLWEGFTQAASDAWEAVKSVFGAVAGFFGDIFSNAWERVVKVFSIAGDIFVDIRDGILEAFKAIVNGIIRGINTAISIPFNGINFAIGKIRGLEILGMTPFSSLRDISVPEIPYLAKGAVLPANRPFLAMVGDQRHGTNVEAPLATIQEAVAAVMGDMAASSAAGQEAIIGMLRQILEAILGIEIGDQVIGQAVARYNAKMAVVRGGSV